MASSMERLRDRWEQISPREQRLIAALAATFVVVIITVLWRSISGGLADIERSNQNIRDALSALHVYRVNQAQPSAVEEPTIEISDEPIRLQSYLEGIATETGITIPGFTPQSPVTRDGFVESSMRIEIRGLSLGELTSFLEKVETKSRQVFIKSLEIKRQFREQGKVDVDLVVTTLAREKKGDSGDKPGDKNEGTGGEQGSGAKEG